MNENTLEFIEIHQIALHITHYFMLIFASKVRVYGLEKFLINFFQKVFLIKNHFNLEYIISSLLSKISDFSSHSGFQHYTGLSPNFRSRAPKKLGYRFYFSRFLDTINGKYQNIAKL